MNKLEIKDLTGYLPYGLQCERFDGKIEIFCIDNIPTALLTNYKPILRPMSDLLHIEIEDTQFALSEIKDILSLDEAEGVYSNV
ncbi:MAG: hypothetical protein PHD21_08020, partial [Flavobacteriales bacterium]|nr:hypothetical protein [Flavobacteriales bacterium]